jgi:release factor family 11
VSIYLATDPASTGAAERIELKNLASDAVDQLRAANAGRDRIAAIDEELADLVDDEQFLRHQAHCAAVFVTPDSLTTFRLPHRLNSLVEVSDRFHVKPLLRAVTFPQLAYVLALAQGSVRLIEVAPDIRPAEVEIADLPLGVASAVGRSEAQSDAELAQRARAVLDRLYAEELREVRERYALRSSEHRVAADVAEVARAATNGAVDTVLVDIDAVVPGSVSDSGAVSFGDADAERYGVLDEIARRVWLSGGRVLAVRRDDIPGREPVAAIVRYASA